MWVGCGLLGGPGRVSASCLRLWPPCVLWLWLEWMGEAVGFCWVEFGGGERWAGGFLLDSTAAATPPSGYGPTVLTSAAASSAVKGRGRSH